jgi:hypothetical protein
MNKLDVQENLTDFKKKLYAESLTIFEEEERNNIVKAMLFLAHKSTIEFFDEQMRNNMPDFIAVLVTMYPNLITTYGDVNSIPVDEDEETSIYDHILYSFYELMANELIETGADIGVFERRENSIDLTPWYKL